ncbi:MAG: YqzL family protein [Bacillota bacterium]
MQTKDLFWHYFQKTGHIGAYLLYKELDEEKLPLMAASDKE